MISCNSERVQNTRELAQEMNNRKIKRITSAQLTSTVDEWGKAVVKSAEKIVADELAKAEPKRAKELCNPEKLAAIQKLEKQFGVQINLLRASDAKNVALPAKERELVDAYLYNAKQKLSQSDNIQPIGDTLLIYNAAVPTENIICKTCSDEASQPFAIWRVVFSKSEVIRRVDPKKLR
ncbi:hypothetical protein [Tellurirhabdus bombi]|uniref:hypothetical protein n=1 Tax=Tellurirhabdus bombi TaxID=2907205 RepID=UPI001F3E1629|nr:hypothetical protein [Tellurirhabdus bombi]